MQSVVLSYLYASYTLYWSSEMPPMDAHRSLINVLFGLARLVKVKPDA